MLDQNICQQVWRPFFDSVGIAVDKSTNTQDGCMALANGFVIIGVLFGRDVTIFEQAHEAILVQLF